MYHSGNFAYDYDAYGYNDYSGYAGQYAAPDAKRFRHEKWNGMRGSRFAHNLQNPYSKPWPYQYGQQSGGNFGPQSIGCVFSQQPMSYPVDPNTKAHPFHHNAMSQPLKPGFSRGLKQSKRGNRNGSQFANQSSSDLKAAILHELATRGRGGLNALELAHALSSPKRAVNQVLYSIEKEGLVDRIVEQPPRWVLKTQPMTTGFHSLPGSCTSQNSNCTHGLVTSSISTNSLHHNVSSRSVVPSRIQATNNKPTASCTSESFDVIPAVAIRDSSVPPVVDVHTFGYSICGFDPPKTAASAENARLSSAQAVDQVNPEDISNPDVLLSTSSVADVPAMIPTNSSDIPEQKACSPVGNSLQMFAGELRKPVGRGRGLLGLLNMVKDRPPNTVGTSSVLDSCQSHSDQMRLEPDQFSDSGQFDSGIVADITSPPSISDINQPIGVDSSKPQILGVNGQPTLHSELSQHGTSCEVSNGPRVGQSVGTGTFKLPLPPKQLIRADPVYKVAAQCEGNLLSKDDSNLSLHGGSFAQSRDSEFASIAESESYKSLPDSLSALSFRASSLPSTRSLADIRSSCAPDRSINNPFAAALGMEDTSIGSIADGSISALSSGQMPEGASGLSLTGESFAALNKNSVSALMEYSQSRHVNVEIKCIGSFGPPHRPVYVSKFIIE